MRKRHHLVVGALGILLLAGSIVVSSAGVSGAIGGGADGVAVEASRNGGHDRGKGGHDKKDKCKSDHGRHRSAAVAQTKDKGKKCKPKPTTTTTVPETTTTVEETTTTVEETTTTTEPTVPEETTPPAEPELEPEVLVEQEETPEAMPVAAETPEVLSEELAFTGVSNGGLAAAGLGLLLMGLALVSGTNRRRQD